MRSILLIVLSTLAAMCLPLSADSLEKGFARAAALVLGIIYIFGSWKTGILLHDSALNRRRSESAPDTTG